MLRHLRVENLALIEHSEVEIAEGMIVLTGETGAGKSLLMESLGLLAGSRATPSLVRSGKDRATVEGLFEISAGAPLADRLRELGLDGDEPGEVILRREVNAAGRSRATVNGRMVPLGQLQEIASHVMEVGSQHDQVALLAPARQRELFDEAAGTSALAAQVRDLWTRTQSIRRELEGIDGESRQREERQELLRFQYRELEEAALEEGEQEQLQAERLRLGNRERLLNLGGLAAACLGEAPPGENAAIDLIQRAMGALEEAAELDPELAPLAEEIARVSEVIGDVHASLNRYVNRADADPARLAEIDERLQVIRRVLRKHGPTEQDAIEALARIRQELDSTENADARRDGLAARLAASERDLAAAIADLSAGRARAVAAFTKPLVAILRDFAMPKVRFDVALTPLSSGIPLPGGIVGGPDGAEEVEFLFSANDGEALQPVRRVASGGELSRLLLALRTMGAAEDRGMLLVFDEVDAGLSGVAARRVGERLAALATRSQVLCVTHNANVAALAGQHLLVEKRTAAGRTISETRLIEGVQREAELARLLDGGKQSEKGLALAAELLARAG